MGRDIVEQGRAVLGIEFGSTRIKACLVDPDGVTLATGAHEWENQFVDRMWTYSLDAVREGLQACFAALCADSEQRYGVRPTGLAALGISAMMHGYLAFDADGELLVPFRTWRNTSTGPAAAELSALFGLNIPLRWSVAHLYQAILDAEPHVPQVASLTTLAGYVHRLLTGRDVLGIGDASGVFPVDSTTGTYDTRLIGLFDGLVADRWGGRSITSVLPDVLPAGQEAGRLTAEGAALLDPTGLLQPGAALCPPEGDAGTGMVATNAVAPRTANVSVGTSVFAMVVLEKPLAHAPAELDLVTTPTGDPVAMVHCNNGASEINAWAGLFGRFAELLGVGGRGDEVFAALLHEALAGDADAGGVLAYNYLSGEPITGLEEGRPLVVRSPDARFTLANFMRAQVLGAFATLGIGMDVLAHEGVELDVMYAHGGLFRTEGVAQRLLAAVIGAPVAVGTAPGDGGAWGVALLAAYLAHAGETDLRGFLDTTVFAGAEVVVVQPDPQDQAGYAQFLDRYRAGLTVQPPAVQAV